MLVLLEGYEVSDGSRSYPGGRRIEKHSLGGLPSRSQLGNLRRGSDSPLEGVDLTQSLSGHRNDRSTNRPEAYSELSQAPNDTTKGRLGVGNKVLPSVQLLPGVREEVKVSASS